MGGGEQRRFSIESKLFRRLRQCSQRVVAVADGVSHGKRVEFLLRQFHNSTDTRKQISHFLLQISRQARFERKGRESFSEASCRARHRAHPWHAWQPLPKLPERNPGRQTDCTHRRSWRTYHSQQFAHRVRPHSDYQQTGLRHRAMQIELDAHAIFPAQLSQLLRISIVNNDLRNNDLRNYDMRWMLSETKARNQ